MIERERAEQKERDALREEERKKDEAKQRKLDEIREAEEQKVRVGVPPLSHKHHACPTSHPFYLWMYPEI